VDLVYGMNEDGIPFRETVTLADRLKDLMQRNPGLSKDRFEKVALSRNSEKDRIEGQIGGVRISVNSTDCAKRIGRRFWDGQDIGYFGRR
jgi:hypothetical protein